MDLLCGCGCRTYKVSKIRGDVRKLSSLYLCKVKECVDDVKKICKDAVETKCRKGTMLVVTIPRESLYIMICVLQ